MTIAAIIAEYNPFHLGHEYHIRKTKEETGADYVLVVMSGDYVQRGEPAICDKYMRTRMALESGADLVIELPTIYATASAEYFAFAGVKLLDSLGCVDFLSFGSEKANRKQLQMYADLFTHEPEEYRQALSLALAQGYNFPKARNIAAKAYLGDAYVDILEQPNHILGIEYLKALKRLNSTMKPFVVERQGAGYHEMQTRKEGGYSSATAMRRALREYELDALHKGLPSVPSTETMIENYVRGDYVDWDDLMPFLDYNILMKSKVLGKYFGMNLDLERRLKRLHKHGESFEDLIKVLHSKTLTDTALQRAMLHIVLMIKDLTFLHEAASIPLPYARILGFRREASPALKVIRQNSRIDIIQKPIEGKNLYKKGKKNERYDYKEVEQAAFLYEIDIRSAMLYEQLASAKAGREEINEFQRPQIIL